MLKHPTERELARYLDRTADAADLLSVDDHLAGCDDCRSKLTAHTQMDPIAASFADILTNDPAVDEHLTYEQLAAYVDGGLDPVTREIADVHSGVCELCALQLSDLKRLKDELAGPAGNMPVEREPEKPGFWDQIMTAALLKWAVPALALILLGIGAWALFFSPRSVPVANVAVTQPTPVPAVNGSEQIPEERSVAGLTNTNSANAEAPPHKPEVLLADGDSRIEIDETGNITGINAGEFNPQIKSALTGGDIHISQDAAKLRSGTGVLMGGGDAAIPFKLTTPVGKVVETDRPQFKWDSVAGAESYVVNVYDDNFNKIASSPPLKVTAWTSSKALKRGGIYNWQVTAVKDGQEIRSPVRPAPDAKFKILDASSANEIAAAKRQSGNSHLLLGIVYAKAGLLDDAEREFQALLKQNPRSEVARRLLNKVKAAR